MTLIEKRHKSKTHHRENFDPNCPKCLQDQGITGIIKHLQQCASQNEKSFRLGDSVIAVEQRRMNGILAAYQKATGAK